MVIKSSLHLRWGGGGASFGGAGVRQRRWRHFPDCVLYSG